MGRTYIQRYDPEHRAVFFVPEGGEDHDPFNGSINVFVCGSLQSAEKMAGILGRDASFAPAVVMGFRHVNETMEGKQVPFMISDHDLRKPLGGVAWLDLTEQDFAKIESIELDGGLRKRIEVEALIGDRRIKAFTFVKKRA